MVRRRKKHAVTRFGAIYIVMIGLIYLVFHSFYADNFYIRLFEMKPLHVCALIVLFFFLSVVLGAVVHEIGHLVFGRLAGFKFVSCRLGNVMLLSKNGKLNTTRDSISGTVGDCTMVAPDIVDGKRNIPLILHLAGGALFNLLFAVICAIPILLRLNAPIFILFCIISVINNLLYVMINIIFTGIDDQPTDGYHIKRLLKNNDYQRVIWTYMKLLEATQNGIGLSDMPDEWFELSESYFGDQIMWNNYQAIIGERMCLQHRYDEAAFLIDSIFDAKSPLWGMTESSLAVVRFHIAVLHGDLDKAKEIFEMHLEKNADMIKNDVSYARVKYGYKLITETDSSCIENEKKHFIAISDGMKMSAYAFMVSYELECCEEMEAAIKEALATRNT